MRIPQAHGRKRAVEREIAAANAVETRPVRRRLSVGPQRGRTKIRPHRVTREENGLSPRNCSIPGRTPRSGCRGTPVLAVWGVHALLSGERAPLRSRDGRAQRQGERARRAQKERAGTRGPQWDAARRGPSPPGPRRPRPPSRRRGLRRRGVGRPLRRGPHRPAKRHRGRQSSRGSRPEPADRIARARAEPPSPTRATRP